MAEAITVARPYAEAIFKLGVAKDNLAQWSKILQLCAEIAGNDQNPANLSLIMIGSYHQRHGW